MFSSAERNFIQKINLLLRPGKTRENRIVKALASGETPSINSLKDLEVFLKHKMGNEEVAILIRKIIKKIGYKGQVEINKGGDGNPYKVEYRVLELLDPISRQEVEKRILELRKSIDEADHQIKQEELQKELLRLASQSFIVVATIWINSFSQEDFEKRKGLIEKAFRTATEILKRKRESTFSIQQMSDKHH
jgi:hypothetical protein